jgi:hypothetical protein
VPVTIVVAKRASFGQLLKLWCCTLVANLGGGYILTWLIMTAFPQLHHDAVEAAAHYIAAPSRRKPLRWPLLGGMVITLMTRIKHGTDSTFGKIAAAVAGVRAGATGEGGTITLFGDAEADYQEALDRHYSEGAPADWKKEYVSSYATMHSAEDWAETFAHYLHIRDTLDTSAAFGLAPAGATFDRRVLGPSGFDTIIEMWLSLAWALNMVNRSMGRDDLYPFVLAGPVLEKMRFIHTVIDGSLCLPATDVYT